jgi:hypothetical protein
VRLRIADVARYLDVSYQRVTQMLAEGKLPLRAATTSDRRGPRRRSSAGPSATGGGPGRGGFPQPDPESGSWTLSAPGNGRITTVSFLADA